MSHCTVVLLPDRRLSPGRIPSDDDWMTMPQFSCEDGVRIHLQVLIAY
jgi:hypothetical protein